MRINESYPSLTAAAVTLGKFDGIHRGHRKLVEEVTARKQFGEKAVLFAVDSSSRLIMTRQERREVLESMGIDVLIECPLDEKFKSTKAETFISEILVGDLGASFVTVGEDFRFGCGRKGTPELLNKAGLKYGFEVRIIPSQMDGHRKISSTFIREELRKGNMEKTASLLGMPYFAESEILHGQGLGHRRLLPTINMIPSPEKLVPPNGVYFTRTHTPKGSWEGITNIGTKPTVGADFVGIETYLFDCSEDLYGERCRVEFFHFHRPEQRFGSLESLRGQLMMDVEAGKDYFT